MGLYDREYYRDDDGGGWGEWLSGRAVVGLIVVTGALYFLQLLAKTPTGDELSKFGGFDLKAVLSGEVWRVFTAGLLHDPGNLLVVVFNMLMLYVFGNPIEQERGGKEFLGFYLVMLVVSYLGELGVQLVYQGVRPDAVRAVIGATGAVNGVIVLFCFLHPRTQLPLVSLPFWPVAAVIVGLSAVAVLAGRPLLFAPYPIQTVAAALFAAAYYRLDWRVTSWLPAGGRGFRRRSGRPPLRVVRAEDDEPEEEDTPEVVPTAPATRRPAAAAVDEQLEAKLDHVLEKVARSGKDSLTAEENQILLRASEIYKRRRGS